MSSITEERKKILQQKLKEMGNFGVQVRSPEESPFYDQPTDYERELERLKPDGEKGQAGQSGYPVPVCAETVDTAEPADPATASARTTSAGKPKAKECKEEHMKAKLSFEEYRERYLKCSQRSNGKSGFTINSDILQLLRDVLRDIRSKTTLTSYIENILLEHLRENQAMLNKAAAQYKRNQTLNL